MSSNLTSDFHVVVSLSPAVTCYYDKGGLEVLNQMINHNLIEPNTCNHLFLQLNPREISSLECWHQRSYSINIFLTNKRNSWELIWEEDSFSLLKTASCDIGQSKQGLLSFFPFEFGIYLEVTARVELWSSNVGQLSIGSICHL